MADAMVTARMSQAKKHEATRVLESLGLNASQAINQFYDYLIAHHASPFAEEARAQPSREALSESLELIDMLSTKTRFSTMSDDEIKRERLVQRGLIDAKDGDQ